MTKKQVISVWESNYRTLLLGIALIVSFNAIASPDVPPNQPVLIRPGDNSIGISTSPTLEISVSDPDPSDKLEVNFYGRTKGTTTAPDFTLILIPDPQNESEFYPDIFISMTNWIVSQQSSRNIVFVTTAGDMVNDPNSNAQYINADAAMDKLDPPGIPYSVGAGNHDEPATIFNNYFGISRFSGKPWYGGHYGTTNENSYSFFSASGMDFILINLDYNPSTAVLDWADALLKANSGCRAIVESHSILNYDNTWSNQSVFTALKDNPNLFLMLCGHTWASSDGAAYRSELGDDGHTIHIMHADYQGYPNGGNGFMRILRFSPSNDKIYATTYSPYTGTSLTASPNQMEMVYDMSEGAGGPYTLIATVNNADNGSSASVTWPDRLPDTEYEWYTTVSDGTTMINSTTWSFTTASGTEHITLNTPDGGENWQVGSAHTITWSSGFTSGTVRIEYTTDGTNWIDINSGTQDDGSYSWTIPNIQSLNCLIRVTDTDGNPSDQSNAFFTIYQVCTPPSIPIVGTLNQPACASPTGSVVLSGLPGGSWTINPGAITGSTSSITISGLNAGTYNFTVTSTAGCTSGATSNVVINTQPVTPVQPGAISGNTSVCQGVSQTYSIAPVGGATSYTWSLPSGWSGSSSSTSITATAGSDGGAISVTANNSCGTSTAASISVTVRTTPGQPVSIAGNTAVCQGVSQTYSIAAVAGATSYTWTLPSGWSGSSNSTSITSIASATSGNISVTADNICGSGVSRILSVTATAMPGQPGSISGEAVVCLGSSQTYSISPVSGATSYIWTLPSGWTGSSSSTSITATVGTNGGTISVTAYNSCGSGVSRTLSTSVLAIPAPTGAISGNTTVCQGISQIFSIDPVGGATSYTWSLPSGWSGSSSSTSITATAGSNGGTISVTPNNSCGAGSMSILDVEIGSIPSVMTSHARGISASDAEGGGDLISDGGLAISALGVCWSVSPDPTITDSRTSDGISLGSFASTLAGLTSGVTYHIRAYATNCSGTGYGSDISYFHLPTDVIDIENDKLRVFPNPVSGMLNIEYASDYFKTINIISSLGVLIGSEKVITPGQQLDFSGYEYGIYILEFVNSSGEISRVKVIRAK